MAAVASDVVNDPTEFDKLLAHDEKVCLANPFVIIIGIDDYSYIGQKSNNQIKMDDLDGVKTDVYTMTHLWKDIYGYNDVKIIYPIPKKQNNNNSEYDKNILEKLSKYKQSNHFALLKERYDSHDILHNTQHLLDYLTKLRSKIETDESNDGLIFYYSGHGVRNCLSLPNGYQLEISKIIDIFNGKNCIHLRDKPKIMIYDCEHNQSKLKGNEMTDTSHCYEGFAQIFANFDNHAINDCQHGSILTQSMKTVFGNPCNIETKSLRDIVPMIRILTNIKSGKGNQQYGSSSQIVDFHDTITPKVYFKTCSNNNNNNNKKKKSISEMSKQRKDDNNNNNNNNGSSKNTTLKLESNDKNYTIMKSNGNNDYKCNYKGCNKKLSSVSGILHHYYGDHTTKYQCDICQKCFGGQPHLVAHIEIHSGEKPFKCNDCHKSFSTKKKLVTHMRNHGEKKFKCNNCEKSFIYKGGLDRHIRIHTREKPFKCNYCQKSFTQNANLKSHIQNIHTGEGI